MKKLLVKFGIIAVLTLSLFFAASCQSPYNNQDNGFKPPAGMGYVQLNFRSPNARTIMPTLVLADYLSFELDFTAIPGLGGEDDFVTISASAMNDPIILKPGEYTLEVTAYFNDPPTQAQRAATGTATDTIEVESAAGTTANVILRGITDGEEEGTFSWVIGLTGISGTLTQADMEVKTFPSAGTTVLTRNLLPAGAGPSGTANIDSGFYYVDFTLQTNWSTGPVSWRQVLHVYENMISTFNYAFTDAHFNDATITVTYSAWPAGVGTGGISTEDHLPGEQMTAPTGLVYPGKPDLDIVGWFTDAGVEWNFITQMAPNTNLTLYAKWEGEVEIITWEVDVDKPPLLEDSDDATLNEDDEITLSLADSGTANGSETITITNAGIYDSITWAWTGGDISGAITGNTLTINVANAPFNVKISQGQLLITGIIDGVPYSTFVNITITD